MTPVEPTARASNMRLVIFAKEQPQYDPLPALINAQGVVMTEWELNAEELQRVMCGGRIRLWIHTCGLPLQPLSIEVIPPDCGMREPFTKSEI